MQQDNTITSSSTPSSVPCLVITKKSELDSESDLYKQQLEDMYNVPIIAHLCNSRIMSSVVNSDIADFSKGASINQIESLLNDKIQGGLYFVITGIKPNRSFDRVMSIRYPLLTWLVKRNCPSRNIYMDYGPRMKWFTTYEPHAKRFLGMGAEFIFNTTYQEVQALNVFDFGGRALVTIQRDALSGNTVAEYISHIENEHISNVNIPIYHELNTASPICDGVACQNLPKVSPIFTSDKWTSTY